MKTKPLQSPYRNASLERRQAEAISLRRLFDNGLLTAGRLLALLDSLGFEIAPGSLELRLKATGAPVAAKP